MNPKWVEEIRERWASPAIQVWPLDTQEARDVRDVHDLLAEIDELRSLVYRLQAKLDASTATRRPVI